MQYLKDITRQRLWFTVTKKLYKGGGRGLAGGDQWDSMLKGHGCGDQWDSMLKGHGCGDQWDSI